MKILIFTDYFQPILGYTPTFLAKSYIKQGHEVLVATSDHYYPFPNYTETSGKILGDRKQSSGISTECGIQTRREKMLFELFNRAKIQHIENIIEQFTPDIVILNGVTTLTNISVCKLKDKYTFSLHVFDSHLFSAISYSSNLVNLFYWVFRKVFLNSILAKVDRFIAVQSGTVEVMRRLYGIPSNRIELIPLGTDTELFRRDSGRREISRKELNISEKTFLCIYTGKFIKEKGIDILIEAMFLLEKKYTDVHLLLIGSGSDEVIELVQSTLQHVSIKNFVPNTELYKWYSAADLGIWPLQESISMVEAASCSLSFICSDKMSATKRLRNNNALLYKEGDAIDLAEKIHMLYKDRTATKEMGNRGRELVEKELSWNYISKLYLK